MIEPIEKKAPNFVFFSSRLRINKRILQLCIGNHELYMRRRRADAIEMAQLRQQAMEAKRKRELEERKRRIIAARKAEEEERQRRLSVALDAARRSSVKAPETPVAAAAAGGDDAVKADKATDDASLAKMQSLMKDRRESTAPIDGADDGKGEEVKVDLGLTREEEAKMEELKKIEESKPIKEEYAKRNMEIKRKQTQLKEELSVLAIKDRMNKLDQIHDQNVREERSKYQTMRLITKGVIKDRVNIFEAL
jgi:hypothetical protein